MYMLRKAAVEFARGIYRREMFIPRRFRQQRSEEIHTKQAAFSLKRVKMWGIRMVKVDSSGIAGKLVNTRMRRDHCVLASPAFTLGLSYLLRGKKYFCSASPRSDSLSHIQLCIFSLFFRDTFL